jgi:Patatin-like phospholipase
MAQHSSPEVSDQYWYGQPGAIDCWFYGVFEGGGAKGVAYSGALLAMVDRRCWFRGVAGASAGAITAALVAAGLSPDEIEASTDVALKQVRTGIWAGLMRLEDKTGYFPSDSLRNWLDDLFKKHLLRRTGTIPNAPVTFAELFAATQIELNIIATDLSLRQQVVFSHLETPNCAVADAVVASSSIPFAFPSCLLRVPDGGHGVSHHTIVDGGVWSNFPMYVFEDAAFRRFYKRSPEVIESQRILGFLLQQGDAEEPPRGATIEFVDSVPFKDLRAKEWSALPARPENTPSGIGAQAFVWLLLPFSLLGRFAAWIGDSEPSRWPTPASRLASYLIQSIDGLLRGIHPIFFAVLACVVVGVGSWTIGVSIVSDQIKLLLADRWTNPMTYLLRPLGLMLTTGGATVAILLTFLTIVGVLANRVLLRAAHRILYGLITTYVAGSGAPVWAIAEKKNVIPLAIPPPVTTLSFEITAKQREAVIASARQATFTKLSELLREEGVLPNTSASSLSQISQRDTRTSVT